MSSVSAETVRMRLMPSRYVGDMCSRPSISLPLLMRCSVWASGFSSCRAIGHLHVELVFAQALEVGAADAAAVLAEQQLRAEQRDQLRLVCFTEGACHGYARDLGTHVSPTTCCGASGAFFLRLFDRGRVERCGAAANSA